MYACGLRGGSPWPLAGGVVPIYLLVLPFSFTFTDQDRRAWPAPLSLSFNLYVKSCFDCVCWPEVLYISTHSYFSFYSHSQTKIGERGQRSLFLSCNLCVRIVLIACCTYLLTCTSLFIHIHRPRSASVVSASLVDSANASPSRAASCASLGCCCSTRYATNYIFAYIYIHIVMYTHTHTHTRRDELFSPLYQYIEIVLYVCIYR